MNIIQLIKRIFSEEQEEKYVVVNDTIKRLENADKKISETIATLNGNDSKWFVCLPANHEICKKLGE